ncbi:exported hypothetical protein [Candidatus Sulfopaludibacter sp. SbA3]|nr:exported hypothetical protein [Candidatus Sulfopaludibacter sp. SbA3]
MKTGILAAAISSLLAAGAFSQTLPEFEVASVKPAQPLGTATRRPKPPADGSAPRRSRHR